MSSIKKNFSYNLVYQILNLVILLVTSPYIARVLGPDKSGIYSYTYSVANFFLLAAMLGVNNYGNRSIALIRDDKEKLSKTFSSIYVLQLLTSAISVTAYVIYLVWIVDANRTVALVQGVYLMSAAFDINWFFFGLEKFKLTVTRNMVIRILSLVGIFVFVKDQNDLILYTFVMAGSQLLSTLALWPYVRKLTKFRRPTWAEVAHHIKPNLVLFIPVLAISIYNVMDKIMLGIMSTDAQVGYYEYSERILQIPMAIINALGMVMLPRMSNLVQKGEKELSRKYIANSMYFTIWISMATTFGLAAIAPVFTVVFYGKQYTACIALITALTVMIPCKAWANVVRTQYLLPNSQDMIYVVSVIAGAVVNVVLNAVLITRYDAMGAVIATIFAEYTVMLIQTFKTRKELEFGNYLKKGWIYVVFGIIMYIAVSFIGNGRKASVMLLLIELAAGGAVYCGLSIVYLLLTGKADMLKKRKSKQ